MPVELKDDELFPEGSVSKDEHWKIAQINERDHWERLVVEVREGGRFWPNFWAPQAELIWNLLRKRNVSDETRILEIGGGVIGHIRWMRKGKLFALDPLAEFFKAAFPTLGLTEYPLRKDMTHIAARIEDIEGLDLEAFDIILMLNCLDHCEDPPNVVAALYKALAPEGLLLESTVIFHGEYVHNWAYRKYHPWAFTMGQFLAMFYNQGFSLSETITDWPAEQAPNFVQELHIWEKTR